MWLSVDGSQIIHDGILPFQWGVTHVENLNWPRISTSFNDNSIANMLQLLATDYKTKKLKI